MEEQKNSENGSIEEQQILECAKRMGTSAVQGYTWENLAPRIQEELLAESREARAYFLDKVLPGTLRNATHAQLDALVSARKELHSFEDWLKGNIRHLDGLSVSWNSGCGLPGYGPVSRAMGHVVAERWEDLVAEARRMLQRKVEEAENAILRGAA